MKKVYGGALTLLLFLTGGLSAADHVDSPSVLADGRTDIADMYVFRAPNTTDRTVMIMTVNPFAGVMSPTTLNPRANYEFNVDKNGDLQPNASFIVRFSQVRNGRQNVRVFERRNGSVENLREIGFGATGENINLRGGGRVFVSTFDDPFFFDNAGFADGFKFTGTDGFAGFNVTGIVMELPNRRLGDSINVWGRTAINGRQIDRMGRAAISSVLVPGGGRKNKFNQAAPNRDVQDFGFIVSDTIFSLNGNQAYTDFLASVLLPDVISFNTNSRGGFINGRKLDDDVIDIELTLLTLVGVTTDMVDDNDKEFSRQFPYLASPH